MEIDGNLLAARELVRIDKKALAPIASNEPISMSVSLLGVGPTFKLKTVVTNTGDKVDFRSKYFISYSYQPSLYK